MSDTKTDKTISISELAEISQISLTAAEYRIEYDINTVEDCQNASEELICGFLNDDKRVNLNTHVKLDDNMIHNIEDSGLYALYAVKVKGKNVGMFTKVKTRVITSN